VSGLNIRMVAPEEPLVGKEISSKLPAPSKKPWQVHSAGNSSHSSLPVSSFTKRRCTEVHSPCKKSKSFMSRTLRAAC
jgi:hypothetical protein